MSWRIVNEILGLALIDKEFYKRLLDDPLEAIQRYHFPLTEHEQQVIGQIKAKDLTELSQAIMEQLAQEPS